MQHIWWHIANLSFLAIWSLWIDHAVDWTLFIFFSHSHFYTAYDDINCWEWMCVNCDDNLYSKFDISPSKMNTESRTTDRPRPTESPRCDGPIDRPRPIYQAAKRPTVGSTDRLPDRPTYRSTGLIDWKIKHSWYNLWHLIQFIKIERHEKCLKSNAVL